jgi:hypothetical protein
VVISLRNAISISSDNTTSNSPDDIDVKIIPVDTAAAAYQELTVKHSSLSVFDSSSLAKIADAETADFSMALRLFADWDDFDRNSYDWISTGSADHGALSLIRNPMKWKAWRNSVWVGCPVSVRSFLGGRAKVYLYFLIAQRSFDTEDAWEVLRQVDGVLTSDGVVKEGCASIQLTMAQRPLMDLISKVRTQDLDVADNLFRRHTSRLGTAYQATVGPYIEDKHISAKGQSAKEKEEGAHSRANLVYTSCHGMDAVAVDRYLSEGFLRVPVRSGLLVTTSKHAVGAMSSSASSAIPSNPLNSPGPAASVGGGGGVSSGGAGGDASRMARRRVCMVERCSEELIYRKQLLTPHPDASANTTIATAASLTASSTTASDVANSSIGISSSVEGQTSAIDRATAPLLDTTAAPPPSTPAPTQTPIQESNSSGNSGASINPPVSSPKVQTAFVHDSLETYSIPVTACSPRPSWQECMLEVLHKYDYDATRALEALEVELERVSMEVHMSKVWDIQSINMLFRVAR